MLEPETITQLPNTLLLIPVMTVILERSRWVKIGTNFETISKKKKVSEFVTLVVLEPVTTTRLQNHSLLKNKYLRHLKWSKVSTK